MEVKLSKKSWHYKLQQFTFGLNTPDLFSLCPYFWLTIFCLIISPIIGTIRFILWLIKTIDDMFINALTPEEAYMLNQGEFKGLRKPITFNKDKRWDYYIAWKKRMHSEGYSDDEISKMLAEGKKSYEERLKELEEKYKITEQELEAREALEKKLKEREAKREIRKVKRKQIWIPIVKWTQKFVNVMITLILMSLLTLVINGITKNFVWDTFFLVLTVIGYIVLLVGITIGIIFVIKAYYYWNVNNGRSPIIFRIFKYIGLFLWKHTGWIFKGIGYFLKSIGKGIGGFFSLFIIYFKANKNDYCPAINWDDED